MTKAKFLILIVIVCCLLTACVNDAIETSDFSGIESESINISLKYYKYKYDVLVNFKIDSDKERFEKRLLVLGLGVEKVEHIDGSYHYTLQSLYALSDNHLEALGSNYSAAVTNSLGEAVVSSSDILGAEFDGVDLTLLTKKEFAKDFNSVYDIRSIFLMVENEKTSAHMFFKGYDGLSFIMGPDDDSLVLMQAAIAFSELLLSAEADIRILR